MKNLYVCTLSAPFKMNQKVIDRVITNLNNLGFDVTFSRHAFSNNGNVSASVSERVSDLMEGFTNPKYDLITTTRGGFNSNEILPFIDYDVIRQHPKPFVGMSDMTTLCVNLWQKADMPTFYGPMFRNFGLRKNPKMDDDFVNCLNNPLNFHGFNNNISRKNVIKSGEREGPLVGGNLAVLCWLLGTPYQLEIPDKAILFLEDDVETNGYYLQMYLTHLKQAGAFAHLSGVVFGQVLPETLFKDKSSFKQIIKKVLGEYTFPILIGANFGHIDHPITIPYGSTCSLKL